eukprot:UN2455
MYCQWMHTCKPIERNRNEGEIPFCHLQSSVHGIYLTESHSLTLQCKVGGKFHVKENILLTLIANKYHEGNMKRTLKRELKESAFAEQKANRIDLLGEIVASTCGPNGSCLECHRLLLRLLPLHMNGNLPVGIAMHVCAMICDLIHMAAVVLSCISLLGTVVWGHHMYT